MKRFGILLSAAGLMAAGLTATPAAAHPGAACESIQGRAQLSTGIYLPTIIVKTNVTFSIATGGCSATGTLSTASCGNSVGTGAVRQDGADHDHFFDLQTAGGVGVVIPIGTSNTAVGVVNITPDVASGANCADAASDGVSVFTVDGGVTLL